MSRPILPEQLIARCRRAAVALADAESLQRAHLAQELADLLAQLTVVAARSGLETRQWLEEEAAAIRMSVLTEEMRRHAPAWAAPLLLPPDLLAAMDGNEYGE